MVEELRHTPKGPVLAPICRKVHSAEIDHCAGWQTNVVHATARIQDDTIVTRKDTAGSPEKNVRRKINTPRRQNSRIRVDFHQGVDSAVPVDMRNGAVG